MQTSKLGIYVDLTHLLEQFYPALFQMSKKVRVYLGNRTVHRAFNRVAELNRIRNKATHVKRMIDSFNSYSGMLKTRNGYKILMRLKDTLAPEWWEYVGFDEYRLCLVPREGYGYREQLIRKYNLKIKKK